MMNKEQKKNYISEIKESFDANDSVLVTHYQGLTVNQLDELRSEMRKQGIMFKITKNRITKLALKNTKCENIANLFSGPTAIALSKDAISSAKILSEFSKDYQNLKILGGVMGNEVLKLEDVLKIATLPTLKEARTKIAAILQSPVQKLVSILLAPGSKIAILALKKSKQST